MGEYALYAGDRIKIGTCEDMYYLRADQRFKVKPLDHNLDPRDEETLKQIRFRFPWPDEDGQAPGDFEDPFRKLYLRTMPPPDPKDGDDDVTFAATHEKVTFTSPHGHRITVSCPYSSIGQPMPYDEGGVKGRLYFDQQAWREGLWVLIGGCGGCGAKFRFPTAESIKPVLDELDGLAYDQAYRRNEERAVYYRSICDRILLGYTDPKSI